MSTILSQVSARLAVARAMPLVDERHAAAAMVVVFGALLVFVAGFAGADLLHAAAHDGRHVFAFPCH